MTGLIPDKCYTRVPPGISYGKLEKGISSFLADEGRLKLWDLSPDTSSNELTKLLLARRSYGPSGEEMLPLLCHVLSSEAVAQLIDPNNAFTAASTERLAFDVTPDFVGSMNALCTGFLIRCNGQEPVDLFSQPFKLIKINKKIKKDGKD